MEKKSAVYQNLTVTWSTELGDPTVTDLKSTKTTVLDWKKDEEVIATVVIKNGKLETQESTAGELQITDKKGNIVAQQSKSSNKVGIQSIKIKGGWGNRIQQNIE